MATSADKKELVQQGLRRAFENRECNEKQGAFIVEYGENEEVSFRQGAVAEVHEASYGTLDEASRWVDVKERVSQQLLTGKTLQITNGVMGCDPKPGVRKVLRVSYVPSNTVLEISAKESNSLELPRACAEGLVSASYGAGSGYGNVSDVSSRVQSLLLKNNKVFATNDELLGDPAPGQVKTLTVKYRETASVTFKLHTGRELGSFEVLAPHLFHDLRETLGVSSKDFYENLTANELLGGSQEASGKSGEIFWRSSDGRFILKTVSEGEVATLLGMLPAYKTHLQEHPKSLLTRYLGAYRLSSEGIEMLFLVMNNVFEGAPGLDVTYDLKGTTEDRWVDPNSKGCLKDNNFAEVTMFVKGEVAKSIHETLAVDTAFLQSREIMDYSLMLGQSSAGTRSPYSELMGGLSATRSTALLSPGEDTTMYIGLVDMLVTYGWKKIMAHGIKSMTIGITEEIDTMPPDSYAERFCRYFHQKIRPTSEQLSVGEVSPELFETPFRGLGRSGGTAAFFRAVLREGQSKEYWIGKDLARARDEVVFYEAAKNLKGKDWAMLKWMTPYKGICRAPCLVKDEVKELEVMLLRNCRDGFKSCRMLDVKLGQVTAVGGWQGKSVFSAFMQNMTVDVATNSLGEGFRLEGFDNPPPVLRSFEEFLTQSAPATTHKKLKRLNLQRMDAMQFLRHFLDLHEPKGAQAVEGEGSILQVELQELVLLRCVEELASLVAACRAAPFPQQWIGSSVMLCFDSGARPAAADLAAALSDIARVHIFDWGRSELNTAATHAGLTEHDRREHAKYWNFYCQALAKLLYACCSLYVGRFWVPAESLAFMVWDKDRLTADDFIGGCILQVEEVAERTHHLKNVSGGKVRTWMRSDSEVTVSVRKAELSEASRLQDCHVATVHHAKNIPSKDAASYSDIFVEVSGQGQSAAELLQRLQDQAVRDMLKSSSHATTVSISSTEAVWEESFEFATLSEESKEPFVRALGIALGRSVDAREVPSIFPAQVCHAGASPDFQASQSAFAVECFPH